MMKLVPILLFIANVLLAGFFFIDSTSGNALKDGDPLKRQINPETIRIIGTNRDALAVKTVKPLPAEEAREPLICAAWGRFLASEVAAVESRLAPLELGNRVTRSETSEVGSYLVIIPPIERRADLTVRMAELTRTGITDRFIINDGELRNAISLGFFKSEEAANRHLAYLASRGVSDAIVAPRPSGNRRVTFLITDLTTAERTSLKTIAEGFPGVEMKFQSCSTVEASD